MESMNAALVFGAGFLSVLSPCVLPVIPIVVAGGKDDHKLRPLLVVAGLALTFMAMGVLSSLFGSAIGSKMYQIEKVAGGLIMLMGILLAFGVNPFKQMGFFSRLSGRSGGRMNGLLLGLLLGLIWIPCVGPILGSVLTLVASKGTVANGLLYLFVYSAGFAIPLLIAGYASQFFRGRLGILSRHPMAIQVLSGLLLFALGAFIVFKGMISFSSFTL